MKNLRYLLEAALLGLAFLIFKALPYKSASNLGGWIGRTIGPRLAASRKAYNNLTHAFPDKTEAEYQTYVRDMWDNLGRVIAEYPHLHEIIKDIEVVGEHHLSSIPNSFLAVGGHLANWELMPFYFDHRANMTTTSIYRAPNNPYVAALLERVRSSGHKGRYAPKSTSGTRALVKTLQDNGRVCILFDQKYNQGIVATFFGRPAKTSPAFAQLARKFNKPILTIWTERINRTQFRLIIEEPYFVGDRSDEEIVDYAHGLLEAHIRKNPGQWLWLHRRWIT